MKSQPNHYAKANWTTPNFLKETADEQTQEALRLYYVNMIHRDQDHYNLIEEHKPIKTPMSIGEWMRSKFNI